MSITKKLYFLIFITILGFISLVSLTHYFDTLIHDLDEDIQNQQNKLLIGTFISDDINVIDAQFSQLAILGNSKRARKNLSNKIDEVIIRLKDSLKILQNGGTLTRTIKLNIAGISSSVKKVKYIKSNNSAALEVIDLLPKVINIHQMVAQVNTLLALRTKYKKEKNTKKYIETIKKIKRYYKTTPAYFQRMSENINRLLYEGDIEYKKIKKQICLKKQKYFRLKIFFISITIIIVLILGLWITFNINKANKELLKLNKNLKAQEKSIKAILDGQSNIVIVSDGIRMIQANDTIVEFFDQFNTVEDFTSQHACICDFFKEYNNDPLYILKKDYDGLNWLEYILQNPHKDFKVIMNSGHDDHHFSIQANKKYISEKDFIIIVSLNDITAEIKSKLELADLNNNLESIIEAKTEELQQLNNNLERKIQEEVDKNRQKDQQMIQQSRFAALGEMIGNIAHQWRQPLSAISSTASGMQLQLELDIASKEEINKSYEDIIGYTEFLTQTIEDFRSFMKQDSNVVEFDINDVVQKAIGITSAGFKDHDIKLITHFSETPLKVMGSPSKLSQVFLNILNNAKDAIVENKIDPGYVDLITKQENDQYIITIQDNAGGIPKNIIDKVFDPYFTTKHQSQGTGIGLYMSKDIVEKHMNGIITVENKIATIEGKEFSGACFIIKIPQQIKEDV